MSATLGDGRKIIFVLLLFNLHSFPISCLGGVFQIWMYSFRNDQGLLLDGSQCSPRQNSTSGSPTNSCRTYFRFCLAEFQWNVRQDRCSYGMTMSPVIGGNSFTFPDQIGNFTNPVNFPFQFAWPSDYSLVIDVLHETSSARVSDPAIMQWKNSNQLSSNLQWSNVSVYSQGALQQMNFGVRVVCGANNYGPNCTVFCNARNDALGHYSCNPSDGSKVCLPGWADPNNYCMTAVCQNNCNNGSGMCVGPNQCRCHQGWQGTSCDICQLALGCSAQHGTCLQPGDCNCKPGWGGVYCTEDLDVCSHLSPCRNGGRCLNTRPSSFQCRCPPGFIGETCLIQLDACSSNPCNNGGTCAVNGSSYICYCPDDYEGINCQSRLTACSSQPCRNGATCVGDSSDSTIYRCNCPPGFTGVNCGTEVDPCRPVNPCSNGGECVGNSTEFVCFCVDGFVGRLCQEPITDCSVNTSMNICRNGGSCLYSPGNNSRCVCLPEYTGSECQTFFEHENNLTTGTYETGSTTGTYETGSTTGTNETGSGYSLSHATVMQQLTLIICLGILIPLVVILIAVLVIIVYKKRRCHCNRNEESSVEQNIRNQINNKFKTKQLEKEDENWTSVASSVAIVHLKDTKLYDNVGYSGVLDVREKNLMNNYIHFQDDTKCLKKKNLNESLNMASSKKDKNNLHRHVTENTRAAPPIETRRMHRETLDGVPSVMDGRQNERFTDRHNMLPWTTTASNNYRQDRCVNQGDVDGIQPYHRAFEYDQPPHASAKPVNIRQGISYSSDNEVVLHATLV